MSSVIKVENLSKKYILSHQGQEKYTTLRDVMANSVKRLGKKLHSPIHAFKRVASLLEVGTGFHPELTGRENVFLKRIYRCSFITMSFGRI